MKSKHILFISMMLAMALLQTCLGQFTATPMSTIYVNVKPRGLGEVGYYLSGGLLNEWPRVTTPIRDFQLVSFPQYTYAYFEAKPYGCAELDKWITTPEDVEKIPTGDPNKLVIYLTKDYITVEAVFKSLPEDKCPYIPVFGSIRIEKNTFYTTLTVLGILSVASLTALSVKKKIDEKRRREEMYREMVKERVKKAIDSSIGWRVDGWPTYTLPYYEPHAILWTAFAKPYLDQVEVKDLERSLLDDEMLRGYRYRQKTPGRLITDSYIAHAHENTLIMLAVKTYLALANIIPSSWKLIQLYVTQEPNWRPSWTPYYPSDMKKEIVKMMKFIALNMDLQREGLEKVLTLMNSNQRYKLRIKNPPEYYEAILAVLDKWFREELGIDNLSRMYRIRPEMAEIPSEEPKIPRKPEWILEEYREDYRVKKDELQLPDNLKPPEWLKKWLEEEEKMKAQREAERAQTTQVKPPVKPEKTVEREEVKLPIEWGELPRYIQKSIEGLNINFREIVESALRITQGDEKNIYREAEKLIQKHYPEIDEQNRASITFTLIDILICLKNTIIEKKTQKPLEIEKQLEKIEEEKAEPIQEIRQTLKPEEKIEEKVIEEEEKTEEKEEVKEAVKPIEQKTIQKAYHKGVEVDGVLEIWKSKLVQSKELHLIDVEAPWIPTCLLVGMYQGHEHKIILLEGKKYQGRRNIMEEIIEDIKKTVLMSTKIPVIIIGRPGYMVARGQKKTVYIERLRELLEFLRRENVSRYGVVMPFQVYVEYCQDIPELMEMKKYVYFADFEKACKEVRGKIPEKSIPYLQRVIALSTILESILARSGEPKQWTPERIPDKDEAYAIGWAVRTIISKAGPLTVEEIKKAGFGEYVESLKALGMVEEEQP